MKKAVALLTAGLFLAGAIAAFTGCDKETPEGGKEPEVSAERKAEIFAAIEEADMTKMEGAFDFSLSYTVSATGMKMLSTTAQKITMKGYEEDEAFFADVFADASSYSSTTYLGKTTEESTESYTMQFMRGENTYAASGDWVDVEAQKGDFSLLFEELKKNEVPLVYQREDSSLPFDVEDVQSFGETASKVNAKVSQTENGYSVKMDAQKLFDAQDTSMFEDITAETGIPLDPTIGGAVTIWLDSELNVTLLDVDIDMYMSESMGFGSSLNVEGELTGTITPLKSAPTLYSLSGMKADMGFWYEPKEEEFFEEVEYIRIDSDDYVSIEGSLRGKVTVTDKNELVIDCTFEAEDGKLILHDIKTYDLSENLEVRDAFFTGWELSDGRVIDEGVRYLIDNGFDWGGYISIGRGMIEFGGEQLIVEL